MLVFQTPPWFRRDYLETHPPAGRAEVKPSSPSHDDGLRRGPQGCREGVPRRLHQHPPWAALAVSRRLMSSRVFRRTLRRDVDCSMGLGDLVGRHAELALYRQEVYGWTPQRHQEQPLTWSSTPRRSMVEPMTTAKVVEPHPSESERASPCTRMVTLPPSESESQDFLTPAPGVPPSSLTHSVTQI